MEVHPKEVTRLVKCLEACHIKDMSVILCLESSDVESERCSGFPAGRINFPLRYLKSCHGNSDSIFSGLLEGRNLDQFMAGTRTII